MSSLDNIYLKMSPALEPAVLAQLHHQPAKQNSEQQIGREVAHDLNNILTIVRGYADRLRMKHADNLALRLELQLISDNARRAESVVRAASKSRQSPNDLVG